MSGNISYTYDSFDRISSKSYTFGSFSGSTTYYYQTHGSCTSGAVSTYETTVGTTAVSYTYTYDNNGNITKITNNNGKTVTYTYDDLGQLTREVNQLTKEQYNYTYDKAGNITRISTTELATNHNGDILLQSIGDVAEPLAAPNLPHIVNKNYTYTNSVWGDLLTSYDGVTITYDEIGNPLSYYNGSSYTFTWNGRRLAIAVKGDKTMSFTYGDDGLRVSKTVNGVTTYYYYDGSLLVAEESELRTIVYIYDINSSPIGFKYKTPSYTADTWDVYYYTKNLQSDIVAVYSSTGTKLISYIYDAWGNFTTTYHNGGASTTAVNNPYTYRGYYYDSDLGMYYLQSRYYDANICRFISSDITSVIAASPMSLTDKNLFAYCDNNPVMRVDYTGEFWHIVIGAVAGALVGGFLGWKTAIETGQDALTGIATGAVLGSTVGTILASGNITAISGGISSVASKSTTDIMSSVIYNVEMGSWEDYALAFAFGSIGNMVNISSPSAGKLLDVVLRPAANQLIKTGTRGKSFNIEKYSYDIITRFATSGGSYSILKGSFFSFNVKVDIGKCFYRSTTRSIYSKIHTNN